MKNWLIVHSEESYDTNQNVIGFNNKKAENISSNDNIIYYIKGGLLKGLYKVSDKPWKKESSWNSNYQIEIVPRIILNGAIDIRPYIFELELFEKHKNDGFWGTVLQGTNNIKELSSYDFFILKNIIANANFEEKVLESEVNNIDRRKRLKIAKRKPDKILSVTINFKRNPDVVAEVLSRANGICNECKNDAPFNRKLNGIPYLEVHHIVKLADGGDDTVENSEALCPNCHRRKHYG